MHAEQGEAILLFLIGMGTLAAAVVGGLLYAAYKIFKYFR